MSNHFPFKWRHFQADIILCAVRWYLRDASSYRDVEERLEERGVRVDHTTVFHWVQRYAPELEKRCRPSLRATNDSYRVDETDITLKKRSYQMEAPLGGASPFLPQRAAATGRCFRRNSRTCCTAWGIKSLGSFQG